MDPFDFFSRLGPPPLDMDKLPPEAATLDGFANAVEQMICALNVIAKYDTAAMAQVWNTRVGPGGDWDMGPVEMATWPNVVEHAQRVKQWIGRNPDMVRIAQDLSIHAEPWPANAGPEGLQ